MFLNGLYIINYDTFNKKNDQIITLDYRRCKTQKNTTKQRDTPKIFFFNKIR